MRLTNYEKDYEAFLLKYSEALCNLGLDVDTKEAEKIVEAFSDTLIEGFKSTPDLYIKPIGTLSIGLLAKRNRVLRGVVYPSRTRYKLRVYMSPSLYDKIDNIYKEVAEEDDDG